MENETPKEITLDDLARLMADGFAESRADFTELRTEMNARFAGVDKRIDALGNRLDYKIDQLAQKLDQHRQETKDGFADVHRMIGGMSHTLADHEERINALEGE